MNRINGDQEPQKTQQGIQLPTRVKKAVDRIVHWLDEAGLSKQGWNIGPMCSIGFQHEWVVAVETLKAVHKSNQCACLKASPCDECTKIRDLVAGVVTRNTAKDDAYTPPEAPLLPPSRDAETGG